jgi:hypothetical protein
MIFNATLNIISAISWRSVLLVEETGVPGENYRPVASHWQTLVYQVHLAWAGFKLTTLVVISTNCIGSYKSNFHSHDHNGHYYRQVFLIQMWSIFVQFLYVPVHVFSFPFRVFCLCVILCLVFHVVCVLFCVLCSMLLVCLDCPFWIAPSVFSNIYLVSAITFLTFQWKRNNSSVISFSISNTLLPNIKYPTSSMVSVLVFSIVRALSSRSKSLALLTYSCK